MGVRVCKCFSESSSGQYLISHLRAYRWYCRSHFCVSMYVQVVKALNRQVGSSGVVGEWWVLGRCMDSSMV